MLIALLFCVQAPALAAQTHIFDANLSLSGDCTTSSTDPVADPGCPEGTHPPSGSFVAPRSVVTDYSDDLYVASYGTDAAEGKEGRIDVFSAAGVFLTEIPDPNGLKNMTVDTNGNLYVFEFHPGFRRVVRFHPAKYSPASNEIEYEESPIVVVEGLPLSDLTGIVVNPINNHLFVHFEGYISEYGSAEEGNPLLGSSIGASTLSTSAIGLAIDAAHERIYASDHQASPSAQVIRVFELNPPHALVMTVDGSSTPAGKFLNDKTTVAVDETTGHFFIYDGGGANVVYEFDESGAYVSTIEHNFQYVFGSEIGIDNGPASPNMGTLFVPSGSSTGHAFAFSPTDECEAEVLSASVAEITESEAHFQAEVNPCNLETSYTFEYTTQGAFEVEGFTGATVAGGGSLPSGNTPVPVSAVAEGLSPETAYRFRATATNALGGEEAEGEFATYAVTKPSSSCPNIAFRMGPSALLPDCRAYELVTPADTNARTPGGLGHLGTYFATREASPEGDRVSFLTEGGSLAGKEGTGSLAGDPYLATREANGWVTTAAGPNGTEAEALIPGSTSPDQGYSFWSTAGGGGSAAIEGKSTAYVRYPDGHSALVGRGSLGTDPRSHGKLISENGSHIVFVSGSNFDQPVQLEPNAPPDGTRTIYDRTSDEVTHVVSLLPGSITPSEGESASYVGASLDGKGVAFSVGNKLYLRFNDEETYEVGENVTFAGVAEGGARIFYVEDGDLFAFDAKAEETIRFTESGDVTPVNVAAGGTATYFVSPSVLTGEANPSGAKAQAGKENLYLSREGTIDFVGMVTERDVKGEFDVIEQAGGLGLWTEAVGPGSAELPGRLAIDPSRTTADGSVMLFESRADLAGYDPKGHAEVYRYDAVNDELGCLSCNPTLAQATSDASLQSISEKLGDPAPSNSFAFVDNLRADGRRAFFQSTEPLVQNDTDGLQDVYEWEAQGIGSCKQPGGCIELVSSGHSARNDYLYGVSVNGDDAFFRSSDLLLRADTDETPSIYDARVGGGFPEPPGKTCEDESCPEAFASSPVLPIPPTEQIGPSENVKDCPRGKHRVMQKGKTRCVKRRHKHHHRKGGARTRGAAK